MSTEIVQVDDSRVVVALGRLALGIRENDELMNTIGASQLVSVRRNFREQGSPPNSWAPLAESTVKRDPKRYGPGHKLLVLSGRLLNSITYAAFTGGVNIGTNLVYARVQFQGSKDMAGSTGPQARIAGRSVTVGKTMRSGAVHYGRHEITGHDGKKYTVPYAVKGELLETDKVTGKILVTSKEERERKSRGRYLGPGKPMNIREHQRFQHIPARNALVFRPEDLARIRGLCIAYVGIVRRRAGLEGA